MCRASFSITSPALATVGQGLFAGGGAGGVTGVVGLSEGGGAAASSLTDGTFEEGGLMAREVEGEGWFCGGGPAYVPGIME